KYRFRVKFMKLTYEDRHFLITRILNGAAISSIAAELKCPKCINVSNVVATALMTLNLVM
ncbi:hypothetical protein, partial [Shewanella inventionis]